MKKIIFISLFVFLLLSPLLSQGKKLKVIALKANIYLDASESSSIVETVERGAILTLGQKEKTKKIWYYVYFTSKSGATKAGYILDSLVELLSEEIGIPIITPKKYEKKPIEKTQEKEAEVPKVEKKPPSISQVSSPKTTFPKRIESKTKSYLGAIIGYAMPSDENYASGLKFGGSLCFGVTKNIAVELSGLRFQSNVKGDPEGLSDGKLSIIPIQLSIQAKFATSGRFIPYILAGGSYYINSFTLDEGIVSNWNNFGFDIKEEVKKAAGFHVGAGIDFFLASNIAFNADFRYWIGKAKGSWTITDQISSTETSGNIENLKINSLILGIGLKFYL